MSTEKPKTCDLCGQPVEIKGFFLESLEGQKQFCCAGCQSIFQLLNENILLPSTKTTKKEE